jgi:hypothetical protein
MTKKPDWAIIRIVDEHWLPSDPDGEDGGSRTRGLQLHRDGPVYKFFGDRDEDNPRRNTDPPSEDEIEFEPCEATLAFIAEHLGIPFEHHKVVLDANGKEMGYWVW